MLCEGAVRVATCRNNMRLRGHVNRHEQELNGAATAATRRNNMRLRGTHEPRMADEQLFVFQRVSATIGCGAHSSLNARLRNAYF